MKNIFLILISVLIFLGCSNNRTILYTENNKKNCVIIEKKSIFEKNIKYKYKSKKKKPIWLKYRYNTNYFFGFKNIKRYNLNIKK